MYHLNHDPRDGVSADVSIAALCMGGDHGISVTGPWGRWPFTWAHAHIMAAIVARIATLKGVDVGESFGTDQCTFSAQQNGPIYTVATHGSRLSKSESRRRASGARIFNLFRRP